jgi:hypothetical protein
LRRRRLGRLRAFWELVTERKIGRYTPDGNAFRKARNFATHLTNLGQMARPNLQSVLHHSMFARGA